jgi:hypothetical protein
MIELNLGMVFIFFRKLDLDYCLTQNLNLALALSTRNLNDLKYPNQLKSDSAYHQLFKKASSSRATDFLGRKKASSSRATDFLERKKASSSRATDFLERKKTYHRQRGGSLNTGKLHALERQTFLNAGKLPTLSGKDS